MDCYHFCRRRIIAAGQHRAAVSENGFLLKPEGINLAEVLGGDAGIGETNSDSTASAMNWNAGTYRVRM